MLRAQKEYMHMPTGMIYFELGTKTKNQHTINRNQRAIILFAVVNVLSRVSLFAHPVFHDK